MRVYLYTEVRDVLSRLVNKKIETEKKLWLMELLKQQEQWKLKADLITDFRVIKKRDALLLQIKLPTYTRWSIVSWRKSCSGFKITVNPLLSAMRNSLHSQIKKWKKENHKSRMCKACLCNTKLQADHANIPFKELSSDFISKQSHLPSEFDYTKFGRKFKKSDDFFRRAWVMYHEQNAKLQWLCKPCNLKKSCKVVT